MPKSAKSSPSPRSALRAALAALLWGAAAFPAAAQDSGRPAVKIRPKLERARDSAGLLAPDANLIDVPTAAVIDYGGFSTRSRFYSGGGVLQYLNFGVFHGLNLGASLSIDALVGSEKTVRVRAPNLQVKYRFYDGTRVLPALALGFDGQGYNYNQRDKRYNHRQRGFFVAATQELGLPGLQAHPSFNISDFDSNSLFGAIPLSYTIEDKVTLMTEWDNINNFSDSRFNAGLRVYMTPQLALDFAVRSIGQGGRFPNGDSRGPERIVQIGYSGAF